MAPETSNFPDSIPQKLLPFLQSQSPMSLTRLYSRPSACLAIFRLLGPMERQIIMNLLWLETSLPSSTMDVWVMRDGRKYYEAAVAALTKLHILTAPSSKLTLNSTFKSAFRMALTGNGEHGSFGVPGKDEKGAITKEALDTYAIERWETILHFMVSSGTGQAPIKPSKGVLYLLTKSTLMSQKLSVTAGSTMRITSTGFQFLLYSPHEQLWIILLQYLKMTEERRMDLVEVLSFLLMLSTMELGQDYSTENLSPTQLTMLEDFQDYGLVWQRKTSSKRFYPTRLATTLTSSSPPLPVAPGDGKEKDTTDQTTGSDPEGFIVLETNYRVYAYTNNPLQIAVLNLFVSLKSRYPNLVVGMLTRESVKRALANGITADQIISYLTTHAHPLMRKNNPILPVTVQDQVRLWEYEKSRLKSQDGFLYTAFASHSDYEFVLEYARNLGVVLWDSAPKRCFFVTTDGHPLIRSFIENRKAT